MWVERSTCDIIVLWASSQTITNTQWSCAGEACVHALTIDQQLPVGYLERNIQTCAKFSFFFLHEYINLIYVDLVCFNRAHGHNMIKIESFARLKCCMYIDCYFRSIDFAIVTLGTVFFFVALDTYVCVLFAYDNQNAIWKWNLVYQYFNWNNLILFSSFQ